MHATLAGQQARFHGIQRQAAFFQQVQPLVPAQVAERQLWQALAGGDDAQAGWGMVQQFVDVATRLAVAQAVQVVEEQGETVVECFQVLQYPRPERSCVGWRERPFRKRKTEGVAQVGKQAEGVVVAGVAAQPGPRRLQLRGVLGEQGALAIAERRAEQCQQAATLGRLFQALQQLRTPQGILRQRRGAQLVRLDGGAGHRCGSVDYGLDDDMVPPPRWKNLCPPYQLLIACCRLSQAPST
ncbi:hypothetical protein D9M71_217950 [compost metagenome]